MMHKKKHVFYILLSLGIILLFFLIMQVVEVWFGGNIAFLMPKGWVALKQRNLLFIVQGLMLLIVLPVFIITFIFTWKYRASNIKAKYDPNWNDNLFAEIIWWGFPFLLVIIISFFTWFKSHSLDPFKPIETDKKPLKIQVVALQWKWLFIYPEQKIATVNYLQIPEKTPINFEITADAPMNSFWIPQLGGQVYAMPKMRTKLYLIADEPGNYKGSSANLSGTGFASMRFVAKATSEKDFENWVQEAKKTATSLNASSYKELAKPSEHIKPLTFTLEDNDLFDQVIMKYMHPETHD